MEIDPVLVISVAIVLLTIAFFAMRSAPAAKKRPIAKFLDKSRQMVVLGTYGPQSSCDSAACGRWTARVVPMRDTGCPASYLRAAALAPRPV
jgi:hypothetical protein